MAFLGADTDELREAGQKCQEGKESTDEVITYLRALIIVLRAAGFFTGGASAAYAEYLETTVVPWLQRISQALGLMAQVLMSNAQAQDDASDGRTVDFSSLPSYSSLRTGMPSQPITTWEGSLVPEQGSFAPVPTSADTGAGSIPQSDPGGTTPSSVPGVSDVDTGSASTGSIGTGSIGTGSIGTGSIGTGSTARGPSARGRGPPTTTSAGSPTSRPAAPEASGTSAATSRGRAPGPRGRARLASRQGQPAPPGATWQEPAAPRRAPVAARPTPASVAPRSVAASTPAEPTRHRTPAS